MKSIRSVYKRIINVIIIVEGLIYMIDNRPIADLANSY